MRIDEYPVLKHFDQIVSSDSDPRGGSRALIVQTRAEIAMLLEEHVRLRKENERLEYLASLSKLGEQLADLGKRIEKLEQSNADR